MSSYTLVTRILYLDIPKKLQRQIDILRKIYNPDAVKRGIAHLSFKQDEDFIINNKQFISLIEKYVKNIKPFILDLDGIQLHFDDDNYTVYVAFKKNSKLEKVIKDFSKFCEPFIDKKSPNALVSTKWEQSKKFFPHITIAIGQGKQNGKKIYQQILSHGYTLNTSISCNSIRINQWKKDHWKIIHKIQLID